MKTTYDDFLAHYGVKGMKWGVRRQNQKKSNKVTRDSVSKMSNEQLRKKTKRLRLETEYKEAKQKHDQVFATRGQKILKDIDSSITKTTGRVIAQNLMQSVVSTATVNGAAKVFKNPTSKLFKGK